MFHSSNSPSELNTSHSFNVASPPTTAFNPLTLLRDIYPGSNSSNPIDFVNANGTLFFTATDDVHGTELWKSDGTQAGTVLVKDIKLGRSSSVGFSSNLTNINGTVFFIAEDSIHGRELWKSDGTEAGTVLVKDIKLGDSFDPFLSSSLIRRLVDVNGTLFFKVDRGSQMTQELWKSDGTEAGTIKVKDISQGFSLYSTD